jgi:pilus assembly protein Flp/PilA
VDFLREDSGAGLVEYALILALVAIGVILAMLFLRGNLVNLFSAIGNKAAPCAGTNQYGACP